jgi:mannosyltransferase OCH1-like enzyme
MAEIKFKPASVTVEKGALVLTVGRTKRPLLTGEINDAASVRKLAGKKDVEVAVSGRAIVAVGRRVAPCYWIICYIPVPDIFRAIRKDIRLQLLNKYLDQKIIDRKFAEQLKASF